MAEPIRRLAIGVATRDRPQMLADLLRSVASLEVPDGTELVVLVVDNDPTGSAGPVVAAAGLPAAGIRYAREAVPGVSAVRNRLVRMAREETADALLFVDDDEVVRPTWLHRLLRVRASTGADVVTGPAVPRFIGTPRRWMVDGGFYEVPRTRPVDSTEVPGAATNNTLVDMAVFAGLAEPFDATFGRSGGEDVAFFRQAVARGFRIAWADDAAVEEWVTPDRQRLGWLLRRGFRNGILFRRVRLDDLGRRRSRAADVVRGGYWVAQGAARVAAALIARRVPGAVAGLDRIAYGLGLAYGALGLSYSQYGVASRRDRRRVVLGGQGEAHGQHDGNGRGDVEQEGLEGE